MKSHLNKIVSHYFEQSIMLFQDDPSFAFGIQTYFFKNLPLSFQTRIQDEVINILRREVRQPQIDSKKI
jgi:hypothetical protein